MTELKWLTRVPLTINAAGELVETKTDLQASKLKGYSTTESVSEYGGVSQRWILVESQERRKSDITILRTELGIIDKKAIHRIRCGY
jgi:transposase